jgi:hypothetical protein
MKNTLFLVFITLTIAIFANDGGVAIVGDELHPIDISNVSMDYERLNIICMESYYEIEVYIELYNHEQRNIEPLLGFEFHRGNLSRDYDIYNNIKYFSLFVNNEVQKFEYKIRNENELNDIHTLVYKPKLIPGINKVYHKFKFPYGFGSAQGIVGYILETGSRWKDGKIKKLEIFIGTELSTILLFEQQHSANYPVSKSILSFEIIGEGKLYNKYTKYIGGGHGSQDREYYSLTQNGYLYKCVQDFIPDRNISFQLLKFTGMEQYVGYDDPPYNWPRENSFITIYDWKSTSKIIISEDIDGEIGCRQKKC